MAIFWRALDWRTHKQTIKTEKGTVQERNKYVDRRAWKTEFAFSESHKRTSLLARRAAAAYILYEAREGFATSTLPENDSFLPTFQPLGKGTVLDALQWLPTRFRLPFAQIIHFALAMFTTRLTLVDVPNPVLVDRFRDWIVKDFESFAGRSLSRYLELWLEEVKLRFEQGERAVRNFELLSDQYGYAPSEFLDFRFEDADFSNGDKALFFHVGQVFDTCEGQYDIGGIDTKAGKF